jgi:hypothetical protein
MIRNGSGKPELAETDETDPERLSQLLESELAENRTAWKRARARYHTIRSMSFLFLFIVICGALFAFFLVFSRISEERANQSPRPASSASDK